MARNHMCQFNYTCNQKISSAFIKHGWWHSHKERRRYTLFRALNQLSRCRIVRPSLLVRTHLAFACETCCVSVGWNVACCTIGVLYQLLNSSYRVSCHAFVVFLGRQLISESRVVWWCAKSKIDTPSARSDSCTTALIALRQRGKLRYYTYIEASVMSLKGALGDKATNVSIYWHILTLFEVRAN
jgi:hypothetical protein